MKSPQSSSLLQAPVKWACPVKLKMKHQNKDLVTPSSSSFSCSSIKAKGKKEKEKKVFVSNPQKQPQSADMFCCIGSPFEKWSLRITHWSFTANWLWPRRSPLLLCGNLCNNVLNSTYRYSSSSVMTVVLNHVLVRLVTTTATARVPLYQNRRIKMFGFLLIMIFFFFY